MATKFFDALDLQKNEVQNAVLQNLSTEPSSPLAGQVFYDTDDNAIKVWNGSSWAILGAGFTEEQIEDFVGAMVSGNTETGISVTYNDGTDKLDFALDVEYLQDTVGAMVSGGTETGIAVSYDDTNARFDFVVAVLNSLPAPTGDLSLNSQKITNLANGTVSTDGVNLGQVQSLVNGLDWKANARAASTTNVNLANGLENGDAIDGVTLATGDRVLLTGQTAPAENGIYVAVASGAASRATDADVSAEVTSGMAVAVTEGTLNGDTVWILTTNDPITLNTTGLTFSVLPTPNSILAGNGITRTGQTIAVDPAIVARKATGSLTGGATSEVLTHNLNTRNVTVIIRNNATPWDRVEVTDEATTANTVTIRSGAQNLPASYTWVVIG